MKVMATNSVGESTPAIAASEIGLIPYICGWLEFGDERLEFDEQRVYPSDQQLQAFSDIDGQKLKSIKILSTPGYQGLQGIQLVFTNGNESPFFKGAFSHSDEEI